MPKIQLQSSDGEVFDVDIEVAKVSKTIKTMLDELGYKEDEEEVIPLANVKSNTLKLVLQWATAHKDDEPQEELDTLERCSDDIPSWDVEFMKMDQGSLFELILAANYLDIKGLLDVSCKTVANMMKGKSPSEIRAKFNIVNDFTPAEERALARENDWSEEN